MTRRRRIRGSITVVSLGLLSSLAIGGCGGAAGRYASVGSYGDTAGESSSEAVVGDSAGYYPSPPPPSPVAAAPSGGEAAPPAAATRTTTTATVTVTTIVDGGPTMAPREQVQRHARLTANSVGDHDRYDAYLGFLSRHPNEQRHIGLDTSRRVRIRVVDQHGRPVNDARLTVHGMGAPVAGRTHADGHWDFFPGVSAQGRYGRAMLQIVAGPHNVQAAIDVPAHGDGMPIEVRLPGTAAGPPAALELGFLIDVTGSMEDELRYVNREVGNIVQRVHQAAPEVQIRVGATFYRDRVDAHVVQAIPFTSDVNGFAQAMEGVRASGGGDYPEDMNGGLEAAMGRMQWAEGNVVRLLVLIADAPPQSYGGYTYRDAMRDAAANGVRILPVAASGADRNVEMLFRAMGVFTSTPYVHLTDDSGIGNGHLDADTDQIAVEFFNDLLTRLIVSDLSGGGTHAPDYVAPAVQGQGYAIMNQ